MIEIQHLTKRFGPLVAVRDLSLTVGPGEVLGFLGPNGAGKSTTMKMVTGYLAPDQGSVRICGHDIVERHPRRPEEAGLSARRRARLWRDDAASIPAFHRRGAGIVRRGRARSASSAPLPGPNSHSVLDQPIETLSKGFRRRVGLAQAILHDPDVLVLDEPTDGLDPNQKHAVRGLIRGMAKNKTIIISTHLLEEVEAICTRAVIIDRGRIVADATPAELAAKAPSGRLDDVFRQLTTGDTQRSGGMNASECRSSSGNSNPISPRPSPLSSS